jgi:hypothetical protein
VNKQRNHCTHTASSVTPCAWKCSLSRGSRSLTRSCAVSTPPPHTNGEDSLVGMAGGEGLREIAAGEDVFDEVAEEPKGALLVEAAEEEEGDDEVEALAVADLGVAAACWEGGGEGGGTGRRMHATRCEVWKCRARLWKRTWGDLGTSWGCPCRSARGRSRGGGSCRTGGCQSTLGCRPVAPPHAP